MPYALQQPLVSGQRPEWRYVAREEDAVEGEVLVGQAPQPGEVWDASTSSLRARTAAESLDHAKAIKRREIKAAADAEYLDKVSMFDGDIAAGKWGRQVALNAYETSVLGTMQDIYSRLRQKIQAVNAAATVSEVEGVAWTP